MIKRFIAFGVDKPILNHIFLVFLFVLSIFAYNKIPKEIFPPSILDAVIITGAYPGASPDILDKMAVKNIEDGIRSLSDIEDISTTIKNGFFSIKVDLAKGANPEDTLNDIKDIIANQRRNLPSDMDEPTAKILKKSFPLITVTVSSSNASRKELLDMADRLKDRLFEIPNLSDISIRGDADTELVFDVNDKKIEAYGLDKSAVITALSSISSIFPIGLIKEKANHLYLSTINGDKDLEKIKNGYINISGKKIRIKDVADVSFKLSDLNEVSHFNGKPNIAINVKKSEQGDSITLVKKIKQVLKEYKKKYPKYDFDTYTDTSVWIRNRLNIVISNIIFGLILVSLSVYIFVSGRIAFVVGIGIPVSFMIGLIATELLGYSLNMLSLLGALMALGMLVDEAIVVAENIYRHLENGEDSRTAAIDGAAEMFPAVLTATSTTIFAFLPLLIISGEMGVFMKIIPIMISILLLSSLFEAFFFLPLHAKDFLKAHKQKDRTKRFWDISKRFYVRFMNVALRYKKTTLSLFLIPILILTVLLAKKSKFQLFPQFDNTQVFVKGKVDINNDLIQTQRLVTKVENVLLNRLPKGDIASITSITGMKLDNKFRPDIAENNFQIYINLHERKPENFFDRYINPYLSPEYDSSDMKRSHDAYEIAKMVKRLTKEISKDKEYEEFTVEVPGAGIVKSDIELAFSGSGEKVKKAVEMTEEKMRTIKGVFNIADDMIAGEKELKFRVNEYGKSLGFSEVYISSELKRFFQKMEIGKMFKDEELIKIKSEIINKDSYEKLKNFSIEIPGSRQIVKLREVVDFIFKPSYAEIYKDNGKRISTVFGSLNKEILTSAEFLKKMRPIFKKIRAMGVNIDIKGEQKSNNQIQREMAEAGVIAIFLIFIALVWMFDSAILSLVVLSTIPLSVLGVLVGNLVMGMNMTMPGLLGLVGLSGVVVNDGIIMIDFIKKSRQKEEVAYLASLRLRPISLTSITTVLGLTTLMFFASGQSVILQPMAIALGFGVAWATVLNLFYVPVLYSVIYRVK
ncbi:MAG: efflux RND transporter permease subunit [Epsilonproteobacteria bacterium]|nr:efflux RND transporter permease subunit [Campylobacterota bacterium]